MTITKFPWQVAGVLAALFLLPGPGVRHAYGQNGSLHLNLKTAAAATELPVGPWGSYSTRHIGPCYLASRRNAPLFAFPIIVGQQRDEVLPIGSKGSDGRRRVRPERVALLRRSSGLAPFDGSRDTASGMPVAHIVDGDADGLLWTAAVNFPKAELAQNVVRRHDPSGQPIAPDPWPAGAAAVSWFPAYAENDAEGLLIRVSLTNNGASEQSYFVDLLGGLDSPDTLYRVGDTITNNDPDGRGGTLRHSKTSLSFALVSSTGDYSVRSYAVSDSIFGPEADACTRDGIGAVLPADVVTGSKRWALTRVSGVTVAPGMTRVVTLCIGIGKDDGAALDTARTLLSLAEDRPAGAAEARDGLYTLALRAHAKARYSDSDPTLERLMAQSLSNTPFQDARRVGVPSREKGGAYRPGWGGWMALGWSAHRSDWSAAQLNAWFVTGTPPQKAINHVLAVPPIDILALWELMQRTHDRDMLERFYPYAVWRFREFLESGREKEDDWLFTWPMPKDKRAEQIPGSKSNMQAAALKRSSEPGTEVSYAPDYSAYVILSAKVLLACARALEKPGDEQAAFRQVIEHASEAMTKQLWDAKRGLFIARPVSTPDAITVMDREDMARGTGIESLLPFVIGPETLTPEQDAALRANLADTSMFLGPAGLRSLSKSARDYRPDEATLGGVHYGIQWLLWKALLDRGDAQQAAALASRVLSAYRSAAEASDGCPEWLHGDTGAACGCLDYTGDSCALLSLANSYHKPGAVSCGWDTYILGDNYESALDSLRIVFRALSQRPKGVLLCVMGKPGGLYHVTGGITGDFKADGNGVLALPEPNDRTTQQIEIAPVGTSK